MSNGLSIYSGALDGAVRGTLEAVKLAIIAAADGAKSDKLSVCAHLGDWGILLEVTRDRQLLLTVAKTPRIAAEQGVWVEFTPAEQAASEATAGY